MDPINHGLEWLKPVAARYRAAETTSVTEQYTLKPFWLQIGIVVAGVVLGVGAIISVIASLNS